MYLLEVLEPHSSSTRCKYLMIICIDEITISPLNQLILPNCSINRKWINDTVKDVNELYGSTEL